MWQVIDNNTDRLQVPGGWVVRTTFTKYYGTTVSCHVSMIFVTDPAHEWEIGDRGGMANEDR